MIRVDNWNLNTSVQVTKLADQIKDLLNYWNWSNYEMLIFVADTFGKFNLHPPPKKKS